MSAFKAIPGFNQKAQFARGPYDSAALASGRNCADLEAIAATKSPLKHARDHFMFSLFYLTGLRTFEIT